MLLDPGFKQELQPLLLREKLGMISLTHEDCSQHNLSFSTQSARLQPEALALGLSFTSPSHFKLSGSSLGSDLGIMMAVP